MRALEQIHRELVQAETQASKNLDDIHPNVRPGWAVVIDKAKATLVSLKREYQEALLKNAVAIFLEGDGEKVREVARQVSDGGGIALDAHSLYERLADEVEPSISPVVRTWGVQQVFLLHSGLMRIMEELGLKEMPMPDRSLEKVIQNREETVLHVRAILRDSVNDLLNRLYLEKQAGERAQAVHFTGSTAPIFIYNASSDEAVALSAGFGKGSGSIAVETNEEVNKEYLTKLMKEANKKIRKK